MVLVSRRLAGYPDFCLFCVVNCDGRYRRENSFRARVIEGARLEKVSAGKATERKVNCRRLDPD